MSEIPITEDLSELTLEAKIDLAVRLRLDGWRVPKIAQKFGVSERTVFNWFAAHRDKFVAELEQQKHVDVFTDQLQMLQEYEAKVLRVASRMGFDLENGEVPQAKLKGKLADYVNLLKLAADLREKQIRLHGFTGTIPKQPERIHHQISATTSKSGENKDDISKLSREDLEKMTLERLQTQLIL